MFRIYLELGAWDLVLFLAIPSALCSMLSRDGDTVRRDRPNKPPPDGLPEVRLPHIDFHTRHIQILVWNRTFEEGQIL